MDRLTFRDDEGQVLLKDRFVNRSATDYRYNSGFGIDVLKDALERLAEYEDLEEQGRLVKLPY